MFRLIDMSPYILPGTLFALALPLVLLIKALLSSKSIADDVSARPFKPPKGWWTDTKRFGVEQRAIFSQVCPQTLYAGVDLTKVELDLRQPSQSVLKGWRLYRI
jgi:hypothetical protein